MPRRHRCADSAVAHDGQPVGARGGAAARQAHAIRGPGMFVIVPFIDNVASWLDQRIQTTEFNAETGALQGHRAGERRRRGVLADPRPRARRAGDHRLPPGHHPGGADLAARNGRLLAALDAAVRPQARRRACCARRSAARPPTGASPLHLGRDPRHRRAGRPAGRHEPRRPRPSARAWPASCWARPNRRSRRSSSRPPTSTPAARRRCSCAP